MPGPGRKAATEATLRIPPLVALEAVDEGQRQLGERAHVEIDHGELLVAIELRRRADQPEAGIVDDNRRLEIARAELGGDAADGVRRARGRGGRHSRPRPAGRGDFVGELDEPVLAARHQHELVSMLRENTGELGTDAGGGAGNQRDRSLHSSPSSSPWLADAPAQLDALVRRNAEQVGGAPEQVVLELVDAAVGVDDLPHHLDRCGCGPARRARG